MSEYKEYIDIRIYMDAHIHINIYVYTCTNIVVPSLINYKNRCL